ncbi:MAG: 5-formyltetrahydrofolate cyclo-ligase [Verrucomicrobiota bacterium]
MISQQKAALRTEMQSTLRALGTAARHQASTRIQQHLVRSPLWKSAEVIMFFSALPGEPRTVELLRSGLDDGKVCVYPKTEPLKTDIRLFSVKSSERLVRGNFGIMEPDVAKCEEVEPETVDLACVPGLGFDVQGNRLGRGQGYYDRFLGQSDFTGKTIGLQFECQLIEKIPTECHDFPVQYLLSEKGLRPAESTS